MTYFCPICGADTQGQSACPNWVNHPGVNTGAGTMTTIDQIEGPRICCVACGAVTDSILSPLCTECRRLIHDTQEGELKEPGQ